MISRRDVGVGALAAVATIAGIAFAQSTTEKLLLSTAFEWADLKAAKTATGAKREVCRAPTATLDQLQIHVTTVRPGERSHEPHRHWEEELIIVKEGTVESMQNGETQRLGPGSIIFEASNELHGIRNAGDTDASYYVIKFWPPGSLASEKN
jgi:quercetin dioxygenase-like cupin family protein